MLEMFLHGTSILLSLYALLSFRDLFCLMRRYRSLFDAKRGERRPVLESVKPLTSVGEIIREEMLLTVQSMGLLEDTLLSKMVQQQEVRTPSVGKRAAQSLSEAFEQVLTDNAIRRGAIVIHDPCDGVSIHAVGIENKRLQQQVQSYCAMAPSSRMYTRYGLHETATATSPAVRFAHFGVAHVFTFALQDAEGRDAYCWLAFTADEYPSVRHCLRLQVALQRMYEQYQANEQLLVMETVVQQAQKQSQATEEFVSHVSHDIRSPLHTIKAVLALMEENATSSDLLPLAYRNCLQLEDMVESILEFKRFSAGAVVPKPQVCNLKEVTAEVLENVSLQSQTKGLELCFESNGLLPFGVYFDRLHLKRIISNLLVNAIKYTNAGSVHCIMVETREGDLELRVQDTGIGIKPDEQEQLFEAFRRGTEAIAGVGLGLTLCKALCEVNHATIALKSAVGIGTTVSVTFPKRILCPVSQVQNVESRNLVAPLDQRPSILLVDDDADSLLSFERGFEDYHIEVLTASGVSEALEICNYAIPSLVVSDMNMPEGGGMHLVKKLQQRKFPNPILLLTGQEKPADLTDDVHYLRKPVTVKELLLYCKQALQFELLPVEQCSHSTTVARPDSSLLKNEADTNEFR